MLNFILKKKKNKNVAEHSFLGEKNYLKGLWGKKIIISDFFKNLLKFKHFFFVPLYFRLNFKTKK